VRDGCTPALSNAISDDSTLRRDEIGIALGWTMLHCGSDATHVRADQFAENVARRLGLR
jgi:hypothetical protein